MTPDPEPLEVEPELALVAMAGALIDAVGAAAFDTEEEGPEVRERLIAAIALIVAADV